MCGNNSRTPRMLLLAAICFAAVSNAAHAGDSAIQSMHARDLVEQIRFIQIPGPNPILTPGPDGAWDGEVVEAADAFRDVGKYYFYFHACGSGEGYRLGVASSDHPLGPFKKHGDKPLLDLGPEGSWDDTHVACAMLLKGGDDKYYMWYSGCTDKADWSIGLAIASHPLGPWQKHRGNPVLKDFGYLYTRS
jgi:beta-xylosidase